ADINADYLEEMGALTSYYLKGHLRHVVGSLYFILLKMFVTCAESIYSNSARRQMKMMRIIKSFRLWV
ncbi:hypothetical protein L9F63_016240, partial [Diploptera punctata]